MDVRVVDALERIAVALERTADADPLAMLDAALRDGMDQEPRDSFAGNGIVVLYKHPAGEGYHIVARRDDRELGGFRVGVEEA